MSETEKLVLVRSYSDKKLAELYQRARKQPHTTWFRMLSDEIGRRDGKRR